MRRAARIPITAIAIFGVGALIAGAVGVAVWLGFDTARSNTRVLLAERAQTIIGSIEATIDARFRPVAEQGQWFREQVASGAIDPSDAATLDTYVRGALSATPEVAGIAVVDANGRSRRWARVDLKPIDEDWSERDPIKTWLASGRERSDGVWAQPFWTPTLDDVVLLHDEPLSRDGEFLGMFGQVVPVSQLRGALMRGHLKSGLTPFVLYGRDRVLVHPLIQGSGGTVSEDSTALPAIDELGDAVLARIWSPDETQLRMLQGLTDIQTALVHHGGSEFVLLYKLIERYGPQPWVVGAYVDVREHGAAEIRRVIVAAIGGIAVMVAAVALAVFIGLNVSRRLSDLSAAAHAVESGDLDSASALGGSRVREIDDVMRAFHRMVDGLRERNLMQSTLGRFVPEPVARTLLDAGGQLEPSETEATVLFCDIEGFTSLTESLGPRGIVSLLNAFFSEMVQILERYGGVVTQFQGDAILATFNVPIPDRDHARNALRAALEMQQHVKAHEFAGQRVGIRIGVNTGTLVAGAVGADKRLSYTVHGDAVNLAARLESMNKRFNTQVLASEHTAKRVTGFQLRRIGETEVRGQTQPVAVFELIGRDSDSA